MLFLKFTIVANASSRATKKPNKKSGTIHCWDSFLPEENPLWDHTIRGCTTSWNTNLKPPFKTTLLHSQTSEVFTAFLQSCTATISLFYPFLHKRKWQKYNTICSLNVFIILCIGMASSRWMPSSKLSLGYDVLLILHQIFFSFSQWAFSVLQPWFGFFVCLFVWVFLFLWGVHFSLLFFFCLFLFAEFETSLYAVPVLYAASSCRKSCLTFHYVTYMYEDFMGFTTIKEVGYFRNDRNHPTTHFT